TVWLRSFGETEASLRLLVPFAWKVRPASTVVKFAGKGDEARVTFTVTPPEKETTDNLLAEVELKSGKKISLGLTNIEYPHIPAHPLLTTPNKITNADFNGWVQERGLYFASEWDPKYTTILSSNDPGESEKPGGELYARHGKGVFVYTSYAWWRQLPAGVAGA